MNELDLAFWTAVAAGTIRSAAPLMLAGLGELTYQRSGVMNLGLEGVMLVGAWATVATQLQGYPWGTALGVGMAAGAIACVLHWYFCVRLRLNQPVVGLALLFLLQGTTAVWGTTIVGKTVKGIPPALKFAGDFDPVLVFALVISVGLWFVLFKTRQGILLRACGESATSVVSAGISVESYRFAAALFSGAMAGLAGGHFAIAYAQQWQENMIAGRGWIALVLVIFAGWHPGRLIFGALLFGGLTSLQINLQIRGWSSSRYLLGMLPFIITIAALVFASIQQGRSAWRAPADLGRPTPN